MYNRIQQVVVGFTALADRYAKIITRVSKCIPITRDDDNNNNSLYYL